MCITWELSMRTQTWTAVGATWPHYCCCCCTLTAGLLDWRHNGVCAALLYISKSQMCFYPSTHTSRDSLPHTYADRCTYVFFATEMLEKLLLSIKKKTSYKKNRSCPLLSPCDASPLPGSVIMESLLGHFFSLFFIWSNYRWRGKRCFFPLLLFSPSYFSSSPLLAFRGALTAAFLLGTCLKGSRSMWCPLTVRDGCFLLALTSQASKDSFSTGTNFSLWIINCIQTLRAVWATCAQGPREDHAVEKRTVEGKKKEREESEMEKKTWLKDKMFSLVLFSARASRSKLLFKWSSLHFCSASCLLPCPQSFSSRWTS